MSRYVRFVTINPFIINNPLIRQMHGLFHHSIGETIKRVNFNSGNKKTNGENHIKNKP